MELRTKLVVLIGTVAALALVAGLVSSSQRSLSPTHFEIEETEFRLFMRAHSKQYTTEAEYQKRLQIFRDNSAFIRLFNSLGKSYSLKVNEFADLTPEEFTTLYVPYSMKGEESLVSEAEEEEEEGMEEEAEAEAEAEEAEEAEEEEEEEPEPPVELMDWREKGAVTGVKNQGMCGSCYSFSAIGAIESAWYLATGELLTLSEQEIVDCSKMYGNFGCRGGLMDNVFEFIMDYGVTSSEIYRYKGRKGRCQKKLRETAVAGISGYRRVKPYDPNALMAALNIGPVSVAVQANQHAFMFYSSGVIDSGCDTALNHGVLAVGYANSEDSKYYVVKNSWGSRWGDSGYVKIAITPGPGVCGINMMPSYPII